VNSLPEPVLSIDSDREGYVLWGTIVWPLDVSRMIYLSTRSEFCGQTIRLPKYVNFPTTV